MLFGFSAGNIENNGGRRRRAPVALTLALVTAAGYASALAVTAPPAAADVSTVSPIEQRASTGVTADALPTVQINGVVWSQVVVGNTVYAGGAFTTARPPGAAPGQNTVPRQNLLAYDIRT